MSLYNMQHWTLWTFFHSHYCAYTWCVILFSVLISSRTLVLQCRYYGLSVVRNISTVAGSADA